MKGTKEIATNNPVNRRFLKQGSEADALADFYSVNADVVSRRTSGAMGITGNTKFQLQLKDRRNKGLPTLQISDPSMSVKIVYTNEPTL